MKRAPSEISLSRLLNRPVSIEERYTSESTRFLHVSSLYTLCVRKVYLLWASEQKEFRQIPFGTLIRFDMGEAVEEKMRRRLEAIGVIDQLQPEFFDKELGIVGHADGRLKNGRLLEIKGKDPALFKLTKRYPLRRDQFQVETYLWMDNTTEGTLLTFTWGDAPVPIHDQSIRYNVKTVDIIKRTIGPLREAENGGPIPSRTCESPDVKEAILCPVRDICFKLPTNGIVKTIEQQIKEKS